MAGAIIPDDWDGETFKCLRIEWPSSDLWEAILLGQMTEPALPSYWDSETGDPDDAANAVVEAYNRTVPAIYFEECDMVPGHPVSAFKAYPTSFLILTVGVWNLVLWDVLFYNHNSPGFNLGIEGHDASSVDKYGIWHYDVQVSILPASGLWKIKATKGVGGVILARSDNQDFSSVLSFDYDWSPGDPAIVIEIFAPVAGTIQTGIQRTWFSGHYLGEVT